MANFVYKRANQTTMKATGFLDVQNMIISIDGEDKTLATLLSDFEGACVEITIKVKDEVELDEPSTSDTSVDD